MGYLNHQGGFVGKTDEIVNYWDDYLDRMHRYIETKTLEERDYSHKCETESQYIFSDDRSN